MENNSQPWYTTSNLLSLARIPLGLLLLIDHPTFRAIVIVLAMLTDFFDGYLARKNGTTSQLGAFLDPLGDKFFVLMAIAVFIQSNALQIWQAVAFVSRDIAVFIFGIYAVLCRAKERFHIQSFWCGKISTTIQFFVLLALTFGYRVPHAVFYTLILLGLLSLCELYWIEKMKLKKEEK